MKQLQREQRPLIYSSEEPMSTNSGGDYPNRYYHHHHHHHHHQCHHYNSDDNEDHNESSRGDQDDEIVDDDDLDDDDNHNNDDDDDDDDANNDVNLISVDEISTGGGSNSGGGNRGDDFNQLESEQDEREFERIFARIAQNKLKVLNNENKPSTDNKAKSTASNESSDEWTVKKLATIRTSLKYLYKLLKYHRLEHYMNELVEHGMYTPMSLSQLNLTSTSSSRGGGVDLDRLGVVSVYDRKKFAQLKQFVRNVIATVNRSKSAASKLQPSQLQPSSRAEDIMIMKNLAKTTTDCSTNRIDNLKKPPQQLFKKNPNLVTGARNVTTAKKFVKNSSNAGTTTTSTASTSRPTSVNKTHMQRARSSEPLDIRKKSANFSVAPSKSTVSIATNSVNHPKQSAAAAAAASAAAESGGRSAKYFGPKLGGSTAAAIVRKIDSQNYDYGVPQSQQQQQQSRLLNKKQQKYLEKIGRNMHESTKPATTSAACSPKMTADIYVFARKRPKLECEAKFDDVICVNENAAHSNSNVSSSVLSFDDAFVRRTGSICVNEYKSTVDGTAILRKNDFTFDKTFDSSLTNESIFRNSILPFINTDSNENRIDFTCICFGQTGSGKTHTLFGNKQQDGFCILTAQHLFSKNQRLFCGFYEIYNGQLYDLLNKNNRLVLREDSNGQLNVVGLIEVEMKSLVQLRKTIEQAQQNRHIGTTSFNKASSRSHAIIQFKVLAADSVEAGAGATAQSPTSSAARGKFLQSSASIRNAAKFGNGGVAKPFRIMFIDLAGSERGIDAQNNVHDNRKEGAEINQSLLALKECIRCIDQFYSHAPFRQSKLTRVLRDCFIGKGRTVLLATVSPTDDCVSCSLNTLQYANRVRQMTLRNRKKLTLSSQSNNNQEATSLKNTNYSNGNSTSQNNYYETSKSSQQQAYNNYDYRSNLYSTARVSKTNAPTKIGNKQASEVAQKEKPTPAATVIKYGQSYVQPTTRSSKPLDNHSNHNQNYQHHQHQGSNLMRSQTNNLASKFTSESSKLNHHGHHHPASAHISTKSSTNLLSMATRGVQSDFNSRQHQYQPPQFSNAAIKDYYFSRIVAPGTPVHDAPMTTTDEKAKKTNVFEFLAPKPVQQQQQHQQQQSSAPTAALIFHPSKINMSSTPIKTATATTLTSNYENALNNDITNKNDSMHHLFEHDTPIKGHKLKYHMENLKMPSTSTQLINQLAEQHFGRSNGGSLAARVTVPDNRDYSSRPLNTNGGGGGDEMTTTGNRDELDTSSKSTSKLYGHGGLQKSTNIKLSSSYSLLNDESLNRLRQKQREMLAARKLLATASSYRLGNCYTNPATANNNNSMGNLETVAATSASNTMLDHSNITTSARSLNDADAGVLLSNSSRHNSQSIDMGSRMAVADTNSAMTATAAVSNSSFDQFRSVINSQRQLRVYIENLEVKLNNLKNEMTTTTNLKETAAAAAATNLNTSNESIDSIKEMSNNNDNGDDEDTKMLKQMQQSEFDDNNNNNNDGDICLKKSLHKGNLTDLYFSKLKTGTRQQEAREVRSPKFSPITINGEEASTAAATAAADEKKDDLDSTLTPRRRQLLLNPKPIKLSPSSPTDSTTSQSQQSGKVSLKLDETSSTNSSSVRLISSTSSRIWNKVQHQQQPQQPTSGLGIEEKLTESGEINAGGQKWSNILMMNSDDGRTNTVTNGIDAKLTSTINVPFKDRTLQQQTQPLSNIIPKDLVVAHQNQLSDITEACKKEADLLDCLRGSKLEFDEYLRQVDEMLSRKVNSIKDLQTQINKLRATNVNSTELVGTVSAATGTSIMSSSGITGIAVKPATINS